MKKGMSSIPAVILLAMLLSSLAIQCCAQTQQAAVAEDAHGFSFSLGRDGGDVDALDGLGSDTMDGPEDGPEDGADGDGKPKDTIAHVLEEALKEEFKHEEEKQAEAGKQFNETVSREEGTQETVVIISQKKEKEKTAAAAAAAAAEQGTDGKGALGGGSSKNDNPSDRTNSDASNRDKTSDSTDGGINGSSSRGGGGGSGTAGDTADGTSGGGSSTTTGGSDSTSEHASSSSIGMEADVDRIIDSHDNEYVLSKPNEEGSMGLTLDPQLIRDFGVLVAVAALAGLAMEAVGQPTINGYFVAGSLVGPGGLQWIKEIVQVQSVAQLGVQLLLFTLGLELSATKLRAVRDVAVMGGLLEVVLMAVVGGAAAAGIGAGAAQGAFIGALLAMSSTSIVIKCLQEARVAHHVHAQITIGTLVLQDCVVGLLFAFTPVLAAAATGGGGVSLSELLAVAGRVLATLAVTVAIAAAASALLLPALTRAAARFSSETFMMASLGFCFAAAMATTRLGISAEVGAFLAGVLLATTDHQEAVLNAVEPSARLFLALFVASTGLAIAPRFLAEHLPVLAAGVAVVIAAKSLVIAGVVVLFRYPVDTALAVGINLAQVGEFGFVLLSLANQQGVIGSHVYLLLMGITALSLLLTPFLLQISTRLVVRGRTSLGPSLPSAASTDVEMASQGSALKHKGSGMPKRWWAGSPGGGGVVASLNGDAKAAAHRRNNGHVSRESSGNLGLSYPT